MTRTIRVARRHSDAFKDFIVSRFGERGETPRSFARNSDYTRQAVEMVIHGYVVSPRIRRDIARYLGFEDWTSLTEQFLREQEEVV